MSLRTSSILLLEHFESSPKILMTIWPSICEIDSSTLSRIGWENDGLMPGISSSIFSILRDQLLLGDIRPPLRLRLQIHQQFGHVDRLGIGAVVGTSGLRYHARDLGYLKQRCRARRAAFG